MKGIISLVLILFTFCTQAQQFDYENTRHISVTGRATMEVVPDIIQIEVYLNEYYKGKQKIGLTIIEAKFIDIIKMNGISPEQYNVDAFSSHKRRYKKKKEDVLAFKKFVVTLKDSKKAAALILELSDADIRASITSKSHTNMVELRKKVKVDALNAAKEKANYLLLGIDSNLGRVLRVKEEAEEESDYDIYKRVRSSSNSINLVERQSIDAKNGLNPIIVTYKMSATFEIID